MHPTYISGDFNINLLKIYQKHHYKHFFEQLTTCGFFQKLVCQQDLLITVQL